MGQPNGARRSGRTASPNARGGQRQHSSGRRRAAV
jgi:hypothetical protein